MASGLRSSVSGWVVRCRSSLLAASSSSISRHHPQPQQRRSFVRATDVVLSSAPARGAGYGRLVDNITELVGNTPCVKISKRTAPPGRTIYAKCEFFNPLGSVKDRLAVAIIEQAEREGRLQPGSNGTVVEATSGNTGIAVAMLCAQRGYRCVIVMAESFSVERRRLMRMLGARVIVTPAAGRGTGMVHKAKELSEKHGWFLCHQFETEANWKFHELTTGPEIINDFKGQRLDYWVTGYGTGGTFHGAGKYIKAHRPDVKIVLAEPSVAPLVASGIATERHGDGSPKGTHPSFSPHPIQGWTPDFIPKVLEDALKLNLHDDYIQTPNRESIATAQALARNEGILTGISGGATMYAAVEAAKTAPEGSVLLAMLPDTGERYLSTPLFGDFAADMNEEELEISKSTPSFQLLPKEE